MNNQDLIPLVKKVAELREIAHQKADKKTLASQELEKTFEYETLQRAIEDFGDTVCDLENAEKELKSASLAVYEKTGEKKPIDKVEIKIFKQLGYDPAEVLAWCRDNAPSLLIVNKKPFEKTAVEIGAPVEVIEKPKCTIGTDLSSYLNTKKEGEKND